jgi:hypothetical protein
MKASNGSSTGIKQPKAMKAALQPSFENCLGLSVITQEASLRPNGNEESFNKSHNSEKDEKINGTEKKRDAKRKFKTANLMGNLSRILGKDSLDQKLS